MKTFKNFNRYKLIKRILLFSFTFAFFMMVIYPYILSIIMGGIIALAVEAAVLRLNKYAWLRKYDCTKLVFMVFFGLLSSLFAWIGFHVYSQILKITENGAVPNTYILTFQNKMKKMAQLLDENFENLNLKINSTEVLSNVSQKSVNYLSSFFSNWFASAPDLILSLFIFFLSLYFFTSQSSTIKKKLLGLGLLPRNEVEVLIDDLQESSYISIMATVITGLVQAIVVAIGCIILSFGDPLLVFAITFIFSFIPLIGAAPVALVLGISALISGDNAVAIGYTIVAFITGTIDNIIRPYIVSSSENKLHPIIVLIAILGGLSIFGLPGLFIAPIVVSLAFNELPKLISSIKPNPQFESKIIIVNETGHQIENISTEEENTIILVTKNQSSAVESSVNSSQSS